MPTNQTASLATDIRDIKPPVDIPNYWMWLWIGLGALAVLTLLLLAWRYLHRRMTRASVMPPVPAHVRAKQKLQEALALIAQPKPFCILVSDTIRTYLEERFTFRAPERTTEEFLHELQGTDLLAGEQKERLGEFLESCDLVKFAKYEPGETELRNLHDSALRLVEETVPTEQAANQASEPIPTSPKQTVATNVHPMPKGKLLAIIGTVLQLAPCIWVVAYVVTVVRMFKTAGRSPTVDLHQPLKFLEDTVAEMNSILGNALVLMLVGLGLGIAGLVLLIIALTSSRYREEWFFWFLIVYGVLLLGGFPIGTAVGVFFIVYCLTKRREFLHRS
jgi:hypothetical protein